MKEFVSPVSEAFVRGIREDGDSLRNSDRMVKAVNLRPYAGGMRLQQIPEPIINGVYNYEWPFPQMYMVSVGFVICSKTLLSHFSSLYEPYSTITTAAGGPWSVADFGKYLFACNGVSRAYIDPTTGYLALYTGTSIPVAGCCCDFERGQLILGDIRGSWYDAGDNFVVWSKIGNADCTPGRGNTSGYRPMDFDGPVVCVKQLGQHVMAYGQHGLCSLKPETSPAVTWGTRTFQIFGVPYRTAVTGDKTNHFFVDTAGDLWRLTANMELIRLGGREFIAPMMRSGYIVVTYHPRRGEVYVSGNGYHYVYTRSKGWGGPNYVPISGAAYCLPIGRKIGGLAVVPASTHPMPLPTAEFITDEIDYKRGAQKTLQWIEVAIEHRSDGLYAAADYRYSVGGDWATTKWVPINKEGLAHLPIAGISFRIRVKAENPTMFNADHLQVRWKPTDRRYSRGAEHMTQGGMQNAE